MSHGSHFGGNPLGYVTLGMGLPLTNHVTPGRTVIKLLLTYSITYLLTYLLTVLQLGDGRVIPCSTCLPGVCLIVITGFGEGMLSTECSSSSNTGLILSCT